MTNVVPLFSRKNANLIKNPNKILDFVSEDAQLSLQFNQPHVLYVISGEISADNNDFYYFASQNMVKTIFDMRFSPNLDFVADSRKKAFNFFDDIGLRYFDVLGRLGVESLSVALDDRHEILKEVVSSAEKYSKNNESFLMIFDNKLLTLEYSRSLRQCFDVQAVDENYMKNISSENIKLQM